MNTNYNGTHSPSSPNATAPSTPLNFVHTLGHVEGRLAALEHKVEHFERRTEDSLHAIDTKLDDLRAALHFSRGGWKTLVVIAAILGTLLSFAKELM